MFMPYVALTLDSERDADTLILMMPATLIMAAATMPDAVYASPADMLLRLLRY